ncbi:hypothetical protein [Pseudonocardia sp. GCM10023141]|uniref:hypothetical protein n=1 Tax=Pseudonocardia sp. GCM10023141 TaxID=3252653 RepID=UPI003616DA26
MSSDPLDLVRLAELDAGLPDDSTAAEQHAAAIADPRAAAVLEALAATRSELAAHAAGPVPPAVAARWAAAVAAERPKPPVATPAAGDRRLRPRPALLAAAVLVVAAVAVAVLQGGSAPAGPTIARTELVAAARSAVGVGDAGELADPTRRAACLRSVDADGPFEAPLLGGRTVVLDGRAGVLLVLGTGRRTDLRIVVVDRGCRTLLAQELVQR